MEFQCIHVVRIVHHLYAGVVLNALDSKILMRQKNSVKLTCLLAFLWASLIVLPTTKLNSDKTDCESVCWLLFLLVLREFSAKWDRDEVK